MNLLPLNITQNFELWPSFSPGKWIDFNPTMITFKNNRRYIIMRRDRVPPVPGEGAIWIIEANENNRPEGEPFELISRGEDPRAVIIGDRFYLFFVEIEKRESGAITGSSMMMAEFSTEQWPPIMTGCHKLPKNPTGNAELVSVTWEKNWVPFVIDMSLIALIYSHDPWVVLLLQTSEKGRDSVPKLLTAYSNPGIEWQFGEIRGGTPPVEYDEEHLITFFHSAQVIGSRNVYMTGACVFEKISPFIPVLVTDEPLLVAPYRSTIERFGWPVLASVIFPLGADKKPDGYELTCGIDDGQIGFFNIQREDLYKRLHAIKHKTKKVLTINGRGICDFTEGSIIFISGSALHQDNARMIRFLAASLKDDGAYVDVGAGDGEYVINLANLFTDLFAIEEAQQNQLKSNVAMNSITNVSFFTSLKSVVCPKNITLLRICQLFSAELLDFVVGAIDNAVPVVVLHLDQIGQEVLRLIDLLISNNYKDEKLFPLMPSVQMFVKIGTKKISNFHLTHQSDVCDSSR